MLACKVLDAFTILGRGRIQVVASSLLNLAPRPQRQHGRKDGVHFPGIHHGTVLLDATLISKDQSMPQSCVTPPKAVVNLLVESMVQQN